MDFDAVLHEIARFYGLASGLRYDASQPDEPWVAFVETEANAQRGSDRKEALTRAISDWLGKRLSHDDDEIVRGMQALLRRIHGGASHDRDLIRALETQRIQSEHRNAG